MAVEPKVIATKLNLTGKKNMAVKTAYSVPRVSRCELRLSKKLLPVEVQTEFM